MRGSQFIGAGWRRHFSVTGCSLVALPLQNHMLMAYCALLYNMCVEVVLLFGRNGLGDVYLQTNF